jgi:hypothetical protein
MSQNSLLLSLASEKDKKKGKDSLFFFTLAFDSSYHVLAEHASLAAPHPHFFQFLESYAGLLK